MKKTALIVCCLLLSLLPVDASLYRTYQTTDGLSHNSVWAVMQDGQGFMWFGTNDGLNRFDGIHFKVFRHQEGDTLTLGNNFIHCMLELPNGGGILVGTKEGLYCYNCERETFSHIALDGKPANQDKNSIHSLVADKQGQIWVGCYGQGIYKLDQRLAVVAHYDKQLPSRYVNTMAFDMGDNLWVGTDGRGLFSFVPTTAKAEPSLIDSGTVQSIYCDNNNTLWVGTSISNLIHYDFRAGKTEQITRCTHNITTYNIKAITPFSEHELVMGSESGLLKLDCTTETLSPFNDGTSYDNLSDNSIFAICKDNEGALWLGTYFYGISYWSPQINNFNYIMGGSRYEHGSGIVKRICEDANGHIWLATHDRGLVVFNPDNHQTNSFLSPNLSNNIQALLIDGNRLLVSNYNRGLAVYDKTNARLLKNYTTANGLPSNIVNVLYKTSNGHIYVGTAKGACLFTDSRFTPLSELQGASVMSIIEDYSGNVWIATHFYGLFCLTANGKITHINPKGGLQGNNLNALMQDKNGNIWIGTEGEGLQVIDPKTNKIVNRWKEADGLPSNIIYTIVQDTKGNVWVTTGGGLVRLSTADYAIRTFDYIESLLKLHYIHNAYHYSRSGKIYLGSSNGFIAFDPLAIKDDTIAPRLLLTDFFVNGQHQLPSAEGSTLTTSISQTQKLELSHSQSTFSFDVACLSYLSPNKCTVAYKLEGFDREWKYLRDRQRHILYMNLPSGHYSLKIKATNLSTIDGNQSSGWSQTTALDIVVRPPFWLSRWMIAVYAIALALFLFDLQRRYRRRIEAANKEKMLKFSLNKEKELYDAKIGFFTNIAHEIRTPLSLISSPLDAIIATGDGNKTTHHNLAIMKSNVGRLLELINQLLDFRKVESKLIKLKFRRSNVTAVVQQICSRYEEFAHLHNIALDTTGIAPDVYCTLDEEAFKKIVGNLMSNALKFSNQHIAVSLKQADDMLCLTVSDDGPGIKKNDQEKIFESFYQIDDHGKYPGTGLGLPLARSLAQLHGGRLEVESEYGNGSKFTLTIPLTIESDQSEVEAAQTADKADEASGQWAAANDGQEQQDDNLIRLLLVEDNDELRSFVVDNMGKGIRVYEAENGIEALDQLEKHSIDIVVSDIMMPEMDGLELCRAIRSNDTFSHLPFVLLSAKTDVETKVDGLNLGADAYLEKPFSLEQLRAQVLSIIDSHNRLRENFIKSPLDYYKKPHHEDNHEKENAEFVEKLNQIILENMTSNDFNIDRLARLFLMSRSNFHKRVKGVTGQTPNDYIRIVRLNKALELLSTGKYQIVEVCYMVGFNTPSYFSKCFYEHFHKLPKEYINEL